MGVITLFLYELFSYLFQPLLSNIDVLVSSYLSI